MHPAFESSVLALRTLSGARTTGIGTGASRRRPVS
jgi:hypothetical protein